MKKLVRHKIVALTLVIALITPVLVGAFPAITWAGAAEAQYGTSEVTVVDTPVAPVISDPVETAPVVDPVSTPVETPTLPATPDPATSVTPTVTTSAPPKAPVLVVPATQSATSAVYDEYPPVDSGCGVVTFITTTEVIVEQDKSFGISGSFSGGVLSVEPDWGGGWTDDMASTFNISMFSPSEVGTYYVNFGDQNASCPRYTVTVHVVAPAEGCGVVTFTSPSTDVNPVVTITLGETKTIAGSYSGSDGLVGFLNRPTGDYVANPFEFPVTPTELGDYIVAFRGAESRECTQYTVIIHVVAAEDTGDTNPANTDPGTTDPDGNAAQNNYGSVAQDNRGNNNAGMQSSLPVTGAEIVLYAFVALTLLTVGIGANCKRLIPSKFRRKTGK